MISKFLICTVIGYVVLLLLVFLFQRQLIYLPDRFKISEQKIAEKGLRYWPSYENHRGFLNADDSLDTTSTIVLFHGNAGAAHHRDHFVHTLSTHAFRVVLAEYPSYGGRSGSPSEAALAQDALETVNRVYKEFGGPIFLWGESMGSGVAAAVAAQTDVPIKALVLLLPWDSLPNLAQTHYWYLPARWLTKDKFNSIENLEAFEGNIAILLAEKDRVIPIQHGMRLYDSISDNKKLWVFKDVDHNYVPLDPTLSWWKEVVEFISQ